VLSILVGIEVDRGDLKGVQQPIDAFFPSPYHLDRNITIEHLLTMTPGKDKLWL